MTRERSQILKRMRAGKTVRIRHPEEADTKQPWVEMHANHQSSLLGVYHSCVRNPQMKHENNAL
jgi:hypothetical protein